MTSKKEHNIGRFKVLHIFENHLGELFFSTAGSGLFKYEPETDSFFRFAMEDNLLMSNYCYYVAESPSHELFVLHNRGISCLNSEKKELTYTYVIPYMSFDKAHVSILLKAENYSSEEPTAWFLCREYRISPHRMIINSTSTN